jgi:hypothetical protein
MRLSVAQETDAAGYCIREGGEKKPADKIVVSQGARKQVELGENWPVAKPTGE